MRKLAPSTPIRNNTGEISMYNQASRQPRRSILAALLVAAVALGAAPQSGAQVPQQRVKISDLDLATAQGQRTFERRVQAAIRRVCPAPASLVASTPRSRQLVKDCRNSARAGVLAQLQSHGIPAVLLASRD
jgi:UrcA family protein